MIAACSRRRDIFEARGAWPRLCRDCYRHERDERQRVELNAAYDHGYQAGVRDAARRRPPLDWDLID